MKALFIDGPGKTSLQEIDAPAPARGEALLRIDILGLCGTDLSTFRGLNPLAAYPRLPGHEVAATIEAVAEGVPEEWGVGRAVTVSPYTNCGKCHPCKTGRPNCCRDNQTMGVQRDGALTRYFALPWEKLIAVDGLSPQETALVEPLSVGFHAAGRGRAGADDLVLVLGCGAIGLGAVAGAAFREATVIAADIDDKKLDIAKKAGAAHAINVATQDLHARLEELSQGHGPSVVIEAIGLPQTFRQAVEEAAFAGRVVYIGYAKEAVSYDTSLFVKKEIDILGSRNALPRDFKDVITMLRAGRFPSGEVVTGSVSLEEAGQALQGWSENPADVIKIHVQLDGA